MGTFVTNVETLFADKVTAPGQALPAGWTTDNVATADNLNKLRNACYDLRTEVLSTTATAFGPSSGFGDSGGAEDPHYFKVGGLVYCQGILYGDGAPGEVYSVANGLPVGFRPAVVKRFAVAANLKDFLGDGPGLTTAHLVFNPDGSVTVETQSDMILGGNGEAFISFDGVCFRAGA